jgi:hypothetical protein
MNSLIGDRSLNESSILHVVMNLDNWHWNYLTVVFSTRTICVWDSLLEVDSFEDSKTAKLQNLFTVFTWEYAQNSVLGIFFFCGIRDIMLDIEKYEFLVLGIKYLIILEIISLIPLSLIP